MLRIGEYRSRADRLADHLPWAALVAPGGLELPDYDTLTVSREGFAEPSIYLLGNLQAGIFLAAVTAVIVGVGVFLFAKRDVS